MTHAEFRAEYVSALRAEYAAHPAAVRAFFDGLED